MSTRRPGMLIVFEGLRGSGKTTCLRTVATRLRAMPAVTVVETAEPTHDTTPGQLARRILRGEEGLADPRSFQLLAAADRLEHVAITIGPALVRGDIVLCDRYVLSSAAFAPADPRAPSWGWIGQMNVQAPMADLTIVLHVPPAVAAQRVLDRDGKPDALATTAHMASRFYQHRSHLAERYARSRYPPSPGLSSAWSFSFRAMVPTSFLCIGVSTWMSSLLRDEPARWSPDRDGISTRPEAVGRAVPDHRPRGGRRCARPPERRAGRVRIRARHLHGRGPVRCW